MKQIVVLAFLKAKRESLQNYKTPLSKHISNRIEMDYKVYISEKTFIRYYDKFILNKDEATGIPNRKILDYLSMYIGMDDFIDFYKKYSKAKRNREKFRVDNNFIIELQDFKKG